MRETGIKERQDIKMKKNRLTVLLGILLTTVMLPFGCLAEAAPAIDETDFEWLFQDDGFYAELYNDSSEFSEDEQSLLNLALLWDYNEQVADWCRQEAGKLPENDEMRKEYEDFAIILRAPLPGRPSEEDSRQLTEQYLANISSQLQEEAVDYYRRCLAAEPAITSDLFDIAEQIGTEMYGVSYRLKSAGENANGVCRIADKITRMLEAAEKAGSPISYKEATELVQDIVRYTQISTPDSLARNYTATRKTLEEKGYTFVTVNNTWSSYSMNAPYRGVNTKIQSPGGIIFELQFHTTESLVVKTVEHNIYELIRDPRVSDQEKVGYLKIRHEMYDRLTVPVDVDSIQ